MAAAPTPQTWVGRAQGAATTVLIVAVAVFIAWQLLKQVIVPLLVIVILVGIFKFALGMYRRDDW